MMVLITYDVATDDAHGRARIVDIEPEALRRTLARGEVAVVAGFQGIEPAGRVTTSHREAGFSWKSVRPKPQP